MNMGVKDIIKDNLNAHRRKYMAKYRKGITLTQIYLEEKVDYIIKLKTANKSLKHGLSALKKSFLFFKETFY